MNTSRCRALAVILILTGAISSNPPEDEDRVADEKFLKDAGISSDAGGLLKILRERTGKDADQEMVSGLIGQLGDDSFRRREKASAELSTLGPCVLGRLRAALEAPDEEIKERARNCIAAIEQRHSPEISAAAVRLLRFHPHPDAPGALLTYIPFAEHEIAAQEALRTLAIVSVRDGKIDSVVETALKDKLPARRAAAALVLGRSGAADQRAVVRALLKDADPSLRLHAAQGLLSAGDRGAIPVLIQLLADSPLPIATKAEEALAQLAGEGAPRTSLDSTPAHRRKCHDAWAAWWKVNESSVDLQRKPVDLLAAMSEHGVHQTVQLFVRGLVEGDLDALKKSTDAPFTILPQETYKTREEVDGFLNMIVVQLKAAKPKLVGKKTMSLGEYGKLAPASEKEFLASLKPATARVVQLQMAMGGRTEQVVLLLRTTGGRTRIVAIGEGKTER